jgi:hypothetical protein
MKRVKFTVKRYYSELPIDIIIPILKDFFELKIRYGIIEEPEKQVYQIVNEPNYSYIESINILFGKFKKDIVEHKVYQIFDGFITERHEPYDVTTTYFFSPKLLLQYFNGFNLSINDSKFIRKPLKEIEEKIKEINNVEIYIRGFNKLKPISIFKNYKIYYIDSYYSSIKILNLLNEGYKPTTELKEDFINLYNRISKIKDSIPYLYETLCFTEDIGLGYVFKGFIVFTKPILGGFTKIYHISLPLPIIFGSHEKEMDKLNIINKLWKTFFGIIDTNNTEGVVIDYIKYDYNLIYHFNILEKLGFEKIRIIKDYNDEVIKRGFTYIIRSNKINTIYKRELRHELILLKRELKISEKYGENQYIYILDDQTIKKLFKIYIKENTHSFKIKKFIANHNYLDIFKDKQINICLVYSITDGVKYAFFFQITESKPTITGIHFEPFIDIIIYHIYLKGFLIFERDFVNFFFKYIIETQKIIDKIYLKFDLTKLIKNGYIPNMLSYHDIKLNLSIISKPIPEYYEEITQTKDRMGNKILIRYINEQNIEILNQHYLIGNMLPNHDLTIDALTRIIEEFPGYLPNINYQKNLIYLSNINDRLTSVLAYEIKDISYSYIQAIISPERFRGKGYGTIILDYFYQKMIDQNCFWVVLETIIESINFWHHIQKFKLIENSNNMIKSLYDWRYPKYKNIKSEKEQQIERQNIEIIYKDTNIEEYSSLLEIINNPSIIKTDCKHPRL